MTSRVHHHTRARTHRAEADFCARSSSASEPTSHTHSHWHPSLFRSRSQPHIADDKGRNGEQTITKLELTFAPRGVTVTLWKRDLGARRRRMEWDGRVSRTVLRAAKVVDESVVGECKVVARGVQGENNKPPGGGTCWEWSSNRQQLGCHSRQRYQQSRCSIVLVVARVMLLDGGWWLGRRWNGDDQGTQRRSINVRPNDSLLKKERSSDLSCRLISPLETSREGRGARWGADKRVLGVEMNGVERVGWDGGWMDECRVVKR